MEVHLVTVRSSADVQRREFLFLSNANANVEIAIRLVLPHEHIILLRIAQLVVIDLLEFAGRAELGAFGRRGVTAVEEAVLIEGGAAEFAPLDQVSGRLQRGEVVHHDLLPIAAGLLHAHGHVPVVLAGADGVVGGGARGIQHVGVNEDLVLAVEPFAHVDYGLVLQAAVLPHEVAVAHAHGAIHFREVVELLVTLCQCAAEGDLLQVGIGDRVLALHPIGRLGARIVLEPAVGVGYPSAVQIIAGCRVFARIRVGDALHGLIVGAAGAQESQRQGKDKRLVHGASR